MGLQSECADVGCTLCDWCDWCDDDDDVDDDLFSSIMIWFRENVFRFGLNHSVFERDMAVGELKGVSGTLSGE